MAESWIRVHANVADKPVVWRAMEALGVRQPEAVGLLVTFWGAVSQHAPNGLIAHLPDAQLESWAGWRGKKGRFAAFIRAKHVDADGRVNEWDDYAGALEDERERAREKKRKQREKRREKMGLSPECPRGQDGDVPGPVPGTSLPTRRDETRRDDVRTKAVAPLSPTTEESDVIAHYRAVHPHRRPGEKDLRAVRKALSHGYSPAELREAIDGNAHDPWHRERSKHELTYVLRDNGQIDTFRERARVLAEPLVDANGIPTERGMHVLAGGGR